MVLIHYACNDKSAQNKNSLETNDTNQSQTGDAEHTTYNNVVASLQGTWKRTDYPYSTIVFDEKTVKFNEGEGEVEPPEFEAFEFTDACPKADQLHTELSKERYDFILVTDTQGCLPIKLHADTMKMYYHKSIDATLYTKEN